VKVALYIGSERNLPLVAERWSASVWLFLAFVLQMVIWKIAILYESVILRGRVARFVR